MKKIIYYSLIICCLGLLLPSCDDTRDVHPTRKAHEMFTCTKEVLDGVTPYFQYALIADYINNTGSDELNSYFGNDTHIYTDEKENTIEIFTATGNVRYIKIEHNGVSLSDTTNQAEWHVHIICDTYLYDNGLAQMNNSQISIDYTVTSQHDADGYAWHFQIASNDTTRLGTAFMDLTWRTESSAFLLDNGTITMKTAFYPERNIILNAETTGPCTATTKIHPERFSLSFADNGMKFQAINTESDTVNCSVSFFVDYGIYYVKTLYKGASENYAQ
ncbi:MAG: hypothetical protein Q4D14_05545 [Bacteroidales bacterium]|nr:hypothetical protein [Bacteroidales bacterium]